LTAGLSGTNAGSFALSKTTINSIAVDGTGTFTVGPNTALTAGTYTATVTVSGGNGITDKTFEVSFTVDAAVYGISLSQSEPFTFKAAIETYGAQEAKTITVYNEGNLPTGGLTAALAGLNLGSFTLSKTSISSIGVDGTGTFTVVPNTGLAAGTYTATVMVIGGNDISKNFTVSFTVIPAVYGINLSQSEPFTFPAAIAGYGAQTPKTITVTNEGNLPTGELAAALSGTNAGSFTLSATPISSIDVEGDDSFTVVPKTGLAAGTYTAMVTVSGGNDISKNFTVSFTVIPAVYDISLSQSGLHTFTEAIAGYEEQTPKAITVNNIGNLPTGDLTAALSGTNAGSFVLSATTINSIDVEGDDSFTVVPKTGLTLGTYTATVTVSGGNSISATFTVSFTVVFPEYVMIAVPAGTVSNNSGYSGGPFYEASTTAVTVSAFSIGETEVTYELWKAVYDWATDNARGANQYTFANPGREGSAGTIGATPTTARQEPVTTINWRDAMVWCNAYSEAVGKTPVYKYNNAVLRESEGNAVSSGDGKAEQAVVDTAANGFRLPTEAQWEYAARGGVPSTGTPWTYMYAGSHTIDNVAVYKTNSGGKAAEVKSKDPNTLGLYDMSGNVREWCQDIVVLTTGTVQVMFRSGYWDDAESACRVGPRSPTGAYYSYYMGFRLAASAP
jgi:formylglycine-generating enzyme required for sulfatase activity